MANITNENEVTTPEDTPQTVTLDQLLSLLMAATQGDQRAATVVRQMTNQFQSPGAPPEYKAMGRSIERILNGERSADVLDDLPPQLADALSQIFGIVMTAAPAGGVVKPGGYQPNNTKRGAVKPKAKKRKKETAACPNCGYENPVDALRCRNCGKKFF